MSLGELHTHDIESFAGFGRRSEELLANVDIHAPSD